MYRLEKIQSKAVCKLNIHLQTLKRIEVFRRYNLILNYCPQDILKLQVLFFLHIRA